MSRLGGLIMGSGDASADPALAISQALAMLPQAVAAGHVSPGAAALLMQALQQEVSSAVGAVGAAQQWAAAGAPGAASLASQPQQVEPHIGSYQQRRTLPTHLGGPPSETPHLPSNVDPRGATIYEPPSPSTKCAADNDNGPLSTAASVLQPVQFPDGATIPSSPVGGPAAELRHKPQAPASEGVDGLLLLSACADVQRQDESDNEEPPALSRRSSTATAAATTATEPPSVDRCYSTTCPPAAPSHESGDLRTPLMKAEQPSVQEPPPTVPLAPDAPMENLAGGPQSPEIQPLNVARQSMAATCE